MLNIPNKYKERFGRLEKAEDLSDDCKYILVLADGWRFTEGGYSYPVKSKAEALEFLKYETVKEEG